MMDIVDELYDKISDLQDEVEALEDLIDIQADEIAELHQAKMDLQLQLSQLISYPDDTPEGRLS